MFNQNVPAKFQTARDSIYKYADSDEVLSYLNKGWKEQSVKVISKDSFKLVVTDKAGECLVFFDMTNKPEAGLVPVDMFMENNGMISANSGLHVGNKIVKML